MARPEGVMMRCISLGAGTQSTTMALMAAAGEIGPMPDCAIFADTGWEPAAVYQHLDRLVEALPFPVHRVSGGNIVEHIRRGTDATGQRFASVPWFTENGGLGRRHCTREFKLDPIAREQRRLLGYQPRQRIPIGAVEVWVGISTDEASRMKPAWKRWQTNRWPLIEQRMSRADCVAWLVAHGWSTPRSACIGCPFHNDREWLDMRANRPDEWREAVAVDRALREKGVLRGMKHLQYMHRQRVPLDQVVFQADQQINLFENECEGMCGV